VATISSSLPEINNLVAFDMTERMWEEIGGGPVGEESPYSLD